MYETLLTQVNNEGIFTITLNRPQQLNALNNQVFTDLSAALDEADSRPDILSVIITGSGEKAFAAGADIKEFLVLNKKEAIALAQRGQDVFFRIENSHKPIIALVNGFALGGGCELAMACHFRIATPNAKFGQPEVNLGLIPGYGGTQRLPQIIGKGRAIEMLISGKIIDAATASQWGLVNAVIEGQEAAVQYTQNLLQTINSKAPLAVAACIEVVNSSSNGEENGFLKEATAFGKCFETADAKEGINAFIEKRTPVFTGN